MVCLHQIVFTANGKNRISKRFSKPEDVDSLTNCFANFNNVHFVTSSTADRRVSNANDLPNITEHAIASTSGNDWATGYNGFELINAGGVPAGFEVFDIKKRDISWQHVSDKGDNKPFRVYDMSSVGEFYRENLDIQNLLREYPKTYINHGLKDFENFIYINWWGTEKGAKLEVFEDNTPLRVRQIHQADLEYVTTSPMITLKHNRGRSNRPRFSRNNCQHMYRAQRTLPNSTIRVRATDPFGRVFEEIIPGKKPFKK